jgi:hypothetical protein
VSTAQSAGDELLHDQLRHLTKSRGFRGRRSGGFGGGGFGGGDDDDDDDDEGFIGIGDLSVFLFCCLSVFSTGSTRDSLAPIVLHLFFHNEYYKDIGHARDPELLILSTDVE